MLDRIVATYSTWDTAIAFGAVVILDYVWALYTAHITAKRPWHAGAYSAAIIVCSGTGIAIYATNPAMILPAALGAFVGTFGAVLWDKRHG